MKFKKEVSRNSILRGSVFSLILVLFASCNSSTDTKEDETREDQLETGVVEIVTNAMDFQMPDTLKSGWNTFLYDNRSPEAHFFLLDKYPEGKHLDDALEEVVKPFQKGMDKINEGKAEEAGEEFAKLPEWFGEVVFTGGSGLISPERMSKTTLKMDPGYYMIECYVKMADGTFHTSMGMIKELIVLQENTGKAKPTASVRITISGEEGITFDKPILQGEQTFEVYFKDQKVHENFVGHDVNLVKLEEGADPDELEAWMNWADPKGLINPAPENVVFLGGVNDCPAGTSGFFTANLDLGNYAFISEVPNASAKNMFVRFDIGSE